MNEWMGNSVTPEISMRELQTKNWGAEILLSCIRRLPTTLLYMYHCHTMHKCVWESMTLYCRYGMTLFTIFGDTQSTWVHLKCTMHTNELHCYSEFNFLAAQIYIEFETKRESNREIWKEGQRERERAGWIVSSNVKDMLPTNRLREILGCLPCKC